MANRVKEDEKNERIIRNLLKLPDNRRCINCNSLGPQYVCTNFSTFVCTTCSGIHREFTHRVKSVSMAKFTPQEVSALQGGGNASAREIYLKEWDPQRNSLPDGSNVERLRDFIKHVYVDRRFTGERSSGKPLREKMGEFDNSSGNRMIDSYQGGSRSPPYEDPDRRHRDRLSGGRSPGYDIRNSENKRSPARAEVVNDWRREDRFANGRRSEDRSSDGGSKQGGRSPDSQRDSDMSSPPVVRPVRDILGDNVSPLRVIEPPKPTGGKSPVVPTQAQRTTSSSSLASSDGNLSEVKVEASFIDFDSVPEVQVASTVPQKPAARDASAVQLAASSGDNWANFDSVPQVNTAVTNSLESALLELSISPPTSGPTSSVGVSSFQSNDLSDLFSGPSFGVTAPTSGFPTGGVPATSLGPTPQLANPSEALLLNASAGIGGGQWPTMRPQQLSPFLGASGQHVPPSVTQSIPGTSSSMPWNSTVAPNTQGPPAMSVGQAGNKPGIDTSLGFASEPSLGAKPVERKALPEDLFAMNYSYFPTPASGFYSASPYGAGVPMQYNIQMASPSLQQAAPSLQPASRSSNPFDFGNEPSPGPASTFPSGTSLQGALPKIATQPGLLQTSNFGTASSHMPPIGSQAPSYTSTISPSPFLGQGISGGTAPRPQGSSGFGLEGPAFASLHQNHQLGGGLPPTYPGSSSFTSTAGNPFG